LEKGGIKNREFSEAEQKIVDGCRRKRDKEKRKKRRKIHEEQMQYANGKGAERGSVK
jgi:hypothetical protein